MTKIKMTVILESEDRTVTYTIPDADVVIESAPAGVEFDVDELWHRSTLIWPPPPPRLVFVVTPSPTPPDGEHYRVIVVPPPKPGEDWWPL